MGILINRTLTTESVLMFLFYWIVPTIFSFAKFPLWSLELVSEFFHNFFAYKSHGHCAFKYALKKAKFLEKAWLQLKKNLELQRGDLIMKNMRCGMKWTVYEIQMEIAFHVPIFFLLWQFPASLLVSK